MLLDAKNIQHLSKFEAPICIIGGGTAGLAMALEFDRCGIDCAVIESGGLRPDSKTRDLNRGESVGIPYYFADGCRSRFLGGTSNNWGGWCRPLADHDFEARSWIADSGWPFPRSELDAFYVRAHEMLKLGPMRYDTDYWVNAAGRPDVRRLPIVDGKLQDAISQFSPPVSMARDYSEQLRSSRLICVYLNANAVEFTSDVGGARIAQLTAKTLTGRSFYLRARLFVLATGGIENARLLLAGSRAHPMGIGNQNDLVGRYFMDHPRVRSGRVQFSVGWTNNKLYDQKFHHQNPAVAAGGIRFAAQLMPTAETQRQEGLLNSNVWFSSILPGEDAAEWNALKRVKHRFRHKDFQKYSLLGDVATIASHPLNSIGCTISHVLQPFPLIKGVFDHALLRGVVMACIVEPAPDRMSRVTLSSERDALGMQRVIVDWRLGDLVKHTFDRSFAIVAGELEARGIAQVKCDPPIVGNEWPMTFEDEGTWHHMGTTRMHSSEKKGVVDADCRVHGMHNLYVAGSSVFPTVGANFPTLTLVALALRLADTLKSEIKS